MIPEQFRLKNTIKYPTSLIVGGLSRLGLEIADSLIDQGGYVIIADSYSEDNLRKLDLFSSDALISFIDYSELSNLDEDLRRLDYIFYFNHETFDYTSKISTQEFLRTSSNLDTTLTLASKFEAKFLLTTSIKAHQLSQVYSDFNNYGLESSERHPVYTEVEVQRYSEGMVMEYIEKSNIDGRIVRLGEVIGEGIDFRFKSFFNELILDVANKEPLKLTRDGLESELLVHLMDAAYGIIKAQFSKDTKGEIFSVSYAHGLTHLSLAYKIQELDPEAKEIQFLEKDNNLPDIKLYKPAKNLSSIGWAPKVPIEKAIMQSIAAAKIHLLENQNNTYEEDSVVNKLKGFLTLADKNESEDLNTYGGAISRLVAERKRQEEEKLDIEDGKSKRFRKKTLKEDATNKIWEASKEAGSSFEEVKRKPLLELVKYGLLISLGIFLFVYIFAPLVSIGKDIVAILPFYNGTLSSLENNSYGSGSLNAEILTSSFKDMNANLQNFKNVVNALGGGENYQQIIAAVNSYSLVSDGVKDIQYAAAPFYEYLNSFENNVQQSNGVETYLVAKTSNKNYKDLLEEVQLRSPYLDSGIEKYKKGLEQVESVNLSLIPSFLSNQLTNVNARLRENVSVIDSLKSMKYIPEILGVEGSRSYLILLLDNTRVKPVGGEISAILEITFDQGKIAEISLKTPEQSEFDLSKVSKETLGKINLRNFTPVINDNLELQDFGNIYDFNEYSLTLSDLYLENFDKKIDGVAAINYESLAGLLNSLSESGRTVRINQSDFNGLDFYNTLEEFQKNKESIPDKHAITAQIYAKLIETFLSDPKNLTAGVISNLNKGIDSKNFLAATSEMEYDSYISQNNLDGSLDAIFGYNIGYNLTDPKIALLTQAPNFDVDEEVRIDSNNNLTYNLNVGIPTLGTSQELSVCIPNSAIEVNIENLASTSYKINSSSTEKCIVGLIKREEEVKVSWKVKFESNMDLKKLQINLPSKKLRGGNTSLSKAIILEPDLTLISIDPHTEKRGNTLNFRQVSEAETNFVIEYSKE